MVLVDLKSVGITLLMREKIPPEKGQELGLKCNARFAMNMGTIKEDVQEKTILHLFHLGKTIK